MRALCIVNHDTSRYGLTYVSYGGSARGEVAFVFGCVVVHNSFVVVATSQCDGHKIRYILLITHVHIQQYDLHVRVRIIACVNISIRCIITNVRIRCVCLIIIFGQCIRSRSRTRVRIRSRVRRCRRIHIRIRPSIRNRRCVRSRISLIRCVGFCSSIITIVLTPCDLQFVSTNVYPLYIT